MAASAIQFFKIFVLSRLIQSVFQQVNEIVVLLRKFKKWQFVNHS